MYPVCVRRAKKGGGRVGTVKHKNLEGSSFRKPRGSATRRRHCGVYRFL